MSHARSGLPPLNLEPFDATPLWAAARAPHPEKHQPRHGGRHPVALALTVVLLLAVVLASVAILVLR